MNDAPLHRCFGVLPNDAYGAAIDSCIEDSKGELWVDNGEYASQVNFCPYCGYRAQIQVQIKTESP